MSAGPDPLATTPDPPYWAVVFTAVRSAVDEEGYGQTAARMVELASLQPGYLGHETARGPDGTGITVSYWESLDAIGGWRCQVDHLVAQRLGRERWYSRYRLRVCRVEAERRFEGPRAPP